MDETGLPKPTLHRMLQQLETAHLLERSGDGRLFGTGVRLRRLAENLRWRRKVREQFLQAFEKGGQVVGFSTNSEYVVRI